MPVVRVAPVPALHGTLRVPPDKSITHRALLLAAVSGREVRISRPLDSADTGATLDAVEASGARAEGHLGEAVEVEGRGLRGLRPPPALDCANAGTLMRLLAGLLVGQHADHVVLDGDDSLRRRPMTRIARPLRAMGAAVYTAPGGTPPIVVSGGAPLRGAEHRLDIASAQVKSCLLLAGLFAAGDTWVSEPAPSRDHTERMLEASGVPLLREGEAVGVRGPVEGLALPDLEVPGDFSSAAPHLVAGALLGDPEVRLEGVNLNPRRTGLLRIMRRMGADVREEPGPEVAGEPCGALVVGRAGSLRATEVGPEEVPSTIDELPLVGVLGAMASGTTVVRGAADLRAKESDRIGSLVRALRALGVRAEEREDGFEVRGNGCLPGGTMGSEGDHRLAMLGAVAGLASLDGVGVEGFEAVAVSYPGFARDLAGLGAVRA
ncbi:MAG TPA: 3-phosphoshikimate 1-carboxyvinyltransferase [Miltoncostaeaceae bacterium]|nr:3-phosphoshikimate 1-carboxyvinyltransferase [Miltoncostaeaceae bacterium]